MKQEKNQNLDTKSELENIVKASFVKRLLALVMDATITAFIMFGFIVLMFVPIADKGFHYSDKMGDGIRYEVASKLFVCVATEDDKVYDIVDLANAPENVEYVDLISYMKNSDQELPFYKERVKYYYLNYKTGVNVEHPEGVDKELYKAPDYKDQIEGQDRITYYTEEWFNAKFGSITALADFESSMREALTDFANSSYMVKLNKELKRIQMFIIFPPYVISFSIFFIVIPLCFKNGETLGKKTLHIGLISKDGFSIKKRQIIFRQSILMIYIFLCTFFIGIGLTSIATLGVGVLIYFIPTFINKRHLSPLDYIAFTMEVDVVQSVWFRNALEKEEKTKEFERNMEVYKTRKVENKNIIQVGSTIVNEDIKRELEAEQNDKK